MSEPSGPGLAPYLGRTPDQRRLLGLMTNDHARTKHGRELGDLGPGAYHAQVRRHLATASIGVRVLDAKDNPRYLIADTASGRVAWITPRKEHRSTFFAPREGAAAYVGARLIAAGPGRVKSLDLDATRPPHAVPSGRPRGGSSPVPELSIPAHRPVYREGGERWVRRL